MNYIINPTWFYWLQIADGIKTVILTLLIFTSAGLLISIVVAIMSYAEGSSYRDELNYDGTPSDPDWAAHYLFSKKCLKILIPCEIALLILEILIPSKTTLISMMITKYATNENLSITVEGIKSAVDYIINAVKEIKG